MVQLNYLHGSSDDGKLFTVVHSITRDAVPLGQVVVIRGVRQVERLSILVAHSSQHSVEYVVVPLILHLKVRNAQH